MPARGVMVATESLRARTGRARLPQRPRLVARRRSGGCSAPSRARTWDLPRPIFLYVGRVAVEKNIRAFLDLDLPGSKVVVGDGPQLDALRRDYPAVRFTGARFGAALARAYAGADVFVFPSLTDTFGLVLLEALACGTPVAAFPVTGPLDVLGGAAGLHRRGGRRPAPRGPRRAGRRSGRLPRARRNLVLARLRGVVPVASGAAGEAVTRRHHPHPSRCARHPLPQAGEGKTLSLPCFSLSRLRERAGVRVDATAPYAAALTRSSASSLRDSLPIMVRGSVARISISRGSSILET